MSAVDLEVAQIIADSVDGDPEDFLDAVPALREHFAQEGGAA